MRNKSVRDKGRQQTGGGIEYRIDVSQTELVADGIFVESYGVAVYRKGHKLCCVKNITVDRERLKSWWQSATAAICPCVIWRMWSRIFWHSFEQNNFGIPVKNCQEDCTNGMNMCYNVSRKRKV